MQDAGLGAEFIGVRWAYVTAPRLDCPSQVGLPQCHPGRRGVVT
jgi:hypothetical protein